jgi:hypothetical protein
MDPKCEANYSHPRLTPERRPDTHLGADRDLASMSLHELLDQVEAEAGTSVLPGCAHVNLNAEAGWGKSGA